VPQGVKFSHALRCNIILLMHTFNGNFKHELEA